MPENAQSAGQRDRSPSYPLIPLEKALDRLRDFEGHFKRNPAYPDKIGAAWDMTSASAVGRIVAALRYFGLLEYQKTGNRHQVSVSEEGRKYLRAQQEEIKAAVIRAAALRPKQIAKYWDKWGEDRPADNVCLDELILNNAFSDRGARRFLKVYDSTITFAGLVQADKLPEDDEGNESNGEDTGLDPDQRGDTPLSQAHLATPTPDPSPSFDVGFSIADGGLQDKPFKFAVIGDRLHIAASVDLKDLESFKKRLGMYEDILKLDDEDNDKIGGVAREPPSEA